MSIKENGALKFFALFDLTIKGRHLLLFSKVNWTSNVAQYQAATAGKLEHERPKPDNRRRCGAVTRKQTLMDFAAVERATSNGSYHALHYKKDDCHCHSNEDDAEPKELDTSYLTHHFGGQIGAADIPESHWRCYVPCYQICRYKGDDR